MKRLFDILVSFFILLLFLPVAVIIAFVISLESKGGVFYFQERIGKNGVPFQLWKFRTMQKNADQYGKLTVGMNDVRITKAGLFLRKYKLDEFPQFVNVLLGQMSIVGPRPEVQEYVTLYSKEQREVLEVKPGITDYASLEYFNENELLGKSTDPTKTYIEEVMPAKLAINRKYVQQSGFFQDIKIMWLTFMKILGRK
jgi:lipopolysaccharide/colanic/teichoic acid biosynthesis glycosyltransferase